MNRPSQLRVAKRAIVASVLCTFLLALSSTSALAETDLYSGLEEAPISLDRVISVKFTDDATSRDKRSARSAVDAEFVGELAADDLEQLAIPDENSLAETVLALRANSKVEFVEGPGRYEKSALPDDAYFWTQWGLNNTGGYFACQKYVGPSVDPFCPQANTRPVGGQPDADIDAPEAWEIATTGSEPVAVVDTGVAYQHTDLAPRIYDDTAESGGITGLDDDDDGYVDDLHGWDFTGDLAYVQPVDDPDTIGVDESQGAPVPTRLPPDNDPRDPDGHGTHVASILGAEVGNAKGIAGINPRARILPLRAADETGSFTWAAINEAVSYAIEKQGVKIVNGSFGGADNDSALELTINANPNVLFVFSAGNGGGDHIGDNHDLAGGANHEYPCDIPADNVICVASTDWNDKLSTFSDYGYQSVDLAAPGSAVFGATPKKVKYCTVNGVPVVPAPAGCSDNPADHVDDFIGGGIGDFKFLDGTSMAAPMVSGAASLIWGANPTLEASQIKTLLVENVDPLIALSGKVGFGGRLNVAKAAQAAVTNPPAPGWPETPPPPPPGPVTDDGSGIDDGSGNTTDPVIQTPVPPIDKTPPIFSLVNPKAARVGTNGKIKFRVRCKEACTVRVTARANVSGSPVLRKRASVRANSTKTLYVQFRGKRLQAIRSMLASGQTVKVYFSLTATDKAGNHGPARTFTVKLAR